MVAPDESAGNHRYGIVNVYGNATAIIGNSYGTSELFSNTPQKQQPDSIDLPDLQSEFASRIIKVLKLFEISKASVREFRRLKKSRKYALQIGTQKSIFKNAIWALLLPCTGVDVAEQMLLDSRHPMWTAERMLDHLNQRLGDSVDVVRQTVELIDSDLLTVGGFIRGCEFSGNKSEQSVSSKLIHSQSCKALTTMNQITQDVVVDTLRNLNSHVIQFQTHLQLCSQQQERVHVAQGCDKSKFKIDRYQRIQEAAEDLYHAFGRACHQHPKHRARLQLQALSENPLQVQFSLLLEEAGDIVSDVSAPDLPFLRLTIESQISENIHARPQQLETDARDRQQSSLKRTLHLTDDEGRTEKPSTQKRVTFALSAKPVELALPARTQRSNALPNFCVSGRFCFHIKNILSHGGCDGVPLGYLHNQGCSKHLIYLRSQTQRRSSLSSHKSSQSSGTLLPLRKLLRTVEQRHHMSKTEMSSFAKQLAMAALQYHTTPWLESWDSDHVLIDNRSFLHRDSNDASNNRSTTQLSDSYLEVSIDNPDAPQRTPVTDRSRTLIRNWIIFSLGVMLLELAYQRPLRDLQEPGDVDQHNEHNTDYYTADRLHRRMAADTGMGSVYAEVVRKCIQCDFGHGSDLTATKLQEGYFEDVIQKLEGIEVGMKNLGL